MLAEGANAYTKCEKKRDAERAEGKREMCDPDTWVKLVELALAARERGDSDLELGPEFEVRSPVEPAKFGDGSTDTPEKQKARLERCELPRPHALGLTPSAIPGNLAERHPQVREGSGRESGNVGACKCRQRCSQLFAAARVR